MSKTKKFFIYFVLMFTFQLVIIQSKAQEVKQIKQSPFIFETEEKAISTSKLTTLYIYVKGVKYFYYVSSRGSYYYVYQTPNGDWKREYNKSLKTK